MQNGILLHGGLLSMNLFSFLCSTQSLLCKALRLAVGLYQTSRPVRKSGKFSKSGLPGNRTFFFLEAGLLHYREGTSCAKWYLVTRRLAFNEPLLFLMFLPKVLLVKLYGWFLLFCEYKDPLIH